ncbi:hypothetical protein WICPIJ_002091 [Wickerhamomyces pijperi]|uniref:PNPLA domain-containing protein n=1 Tax=Wickerhamomyces pijperi TaxID=599730 RepID=A0A9P8TQ50_WICPI|nr:hypothetical protein WICPIJ_002091 [Wickerhamomyces pijperi]
MDESFVNEDHLIAFRKALELLLNLNKQSQNYHQWIDNALKLDEYLNLNQWKLKKFFYYYDYHTILITTQTLQKLTAQGRTEELMLTLNNCLRSNFAGTENAVIYSQTYYGTKAIVEEYNSQVQKSLLCIIDDLTLPSVLKYQFFKNISSNFGKSTLCLSGGACFAYNHFGVIKALLDQDLLPDIISGTSGGGIVAALTATRTNKELKELIKPELANRITACSDPFSVSTRRLITTGAKYDAVDWARKAMFFTRGSMTFKEAYQRTGKVLNISTVPADPHSPVILCNHITSPNCVIWSAVLASSAVPGVLKPVVLMNKDPHTGVLSPFAFGSRFKDGSLRTDIPLESLNTYFNTKFSIVSQVNPHISIFQYSPRGSVGSPVLRRKVGLRGGFVAAGLENYLKLENLKWFKLMRSLDLLPHVGEQDWSNVWLQKFSGTVTIYPRMKISDLYYILSDPTEERLEEMIRNGERATWPKLLFVRHRLDIERLILYGLKKYKGIVKGQRNGGHLGLAGASVETISPVVSEDEHNVLEQSKIIVDFDSRLQTDGLQLQKKFSNQLPTAGETKSDTEELSFDEQELEIDRLLSEDEHLDNLVA